MKLEYRPMRRQDAPQCAKLFAILYDADEYEQEREILAFAEDENNAFFVADDGEAIAACCHCALRHDYVEGTESSPVGYLEGIFVLPQHRGHGIAQGLLKQCEQWAKSKGCTEFASDCLLENTESQQFHEKTGFTEAGRIVCYKKSL